jgi:hypothetical protein
MTDSTKLNGEQKEALILFETLPTFVKNGFVPCTPLFDVGVDLVVFKELSKKEPRSIDVTLKIQSKSRFTLDEKYFGRNIWMLFPNEPKAGTREYFLCPHDQMIELVDMKMKTSKSWIGGDYSQAFDLSTKRFAFLADFRLGEVLSQLSKNNFVDRKVAISWQVPQ